ncbi:hypothetical protein ACFLW0_01750 [Chloroflexota bacterium]
MIKTAVRCPNDMVMVFDEMGEQVPEYQGWYEEVRDGILRDAPLDAAFGYFIDAVPEIQDVPRVEW